ncbi:MAG: glutathione peroxidase [Deltaproteobacteria bacterium]|nr:glutathione peroxidase [Deltaproteobacteria bacterium]
MRLTRLDDSPVDEALDGKPWLVVNVASYCGYTPQYEGLQALAAETPDLFVIGVPCNQFGFQEPGSPEDIARFCETTYGVTFPLLSKQDVNGPDRSALYRHLVGDGPDVKWNFEKFVVDRQGRVIARFPSRTRPEDGALREAIAAALAS